MEASLLLPAVMLITLLMLLAGLYVYQQAALYYWASLSAHRLADAWDNSGKNLVTGQYPAGRQDGLYWRLLDDGIASPVSMLRGNYAVQIGLGDQSGQEQQSGAGPARKLARLEQILPSSVSGSVSYTNRMYERIISLRLELPMRMPALAAKALRVEKQTAEVQARVVDPVEFIRTVDLLHSYGNLLLGRFTGEETARWADRVKSPVSRGQEPLAFRTKAEAKDYLQRWVQGLGRHVSTELTGKWRVLDAVDSSGIAHQVKVGYVSNSKQIKEQVLKDAELLQKGEVKGVVWHFFRREGSDSFGPSKPLRSNLERRGIMVIVHE